MSLDNALANKPARLRYSWLRTRIPEQINNPGPGIPFDAWDDVNAADGLIGDCDVHDDGVSNDSGPSRVTQEALSAL